ncbi:MAG TPA: tRNA threonylcarbamoyladenosine dehydratase [Bacteroidales bacterium]|jgi:tRNA A37 threonylcarbamoyladenosine dehydratase|nr:tRNA threonylcarbamoyladenosine dehydratase [Bacteroidales bacterium]MZQ79673.1 tRNA threonylcarbamoyladenosine dehydratase [Bacteroidales bacterium]HHU98715.1 tRNA threonylcarbamoyladenosine dehydratase [Bacteroidales bacterium]HNV65726.1 tRNA threonylcarbamoyladenosine dehydratase [Bacteroidales bacterium]HNY57551.1 tRNA threonylcarbamoyladenosine dehydratase [Bacteroidales bacterium]
MEGWLARTEMLLGPEALKRLKESHVLVAGLGGVGSWAAEMICRAGTGAMTIIDGDVVTAANRNRQLPALISTTGRKKADVMGERLLDINPGLQLRIIDEFIRDQRMVDILEAEKYDFVVDAIDTLSPKVFLIYHSLRLKLRVVSSMGAGGRFDPTAIRVSDISETNFCNLARMLRKKLHKLGVYEGFTAVYSPEVVDKSLIVRGSDESNKASSVGTISYMPAAFGIACASVVIRELAGVTGAD